MIRKADEGLRERLAQFLTRDAFGVKLAGDVAAYGLSQPFAEFWVQLQEENQIVAAAGRLDGALTVCASPQEGELADELRAFCAMLPSVAQVTGPPGLLAGFSPLAGGVVMTLCEEGEASASDGVRSELSPRDIAELLCACEGEGMTLPECDALYVDLSHRLRHGVTRGRGMYEEGCLVSVALTTAEAGDQAIIGGVATHPEARCKGYSTRVLAALCGELKQEGKDVLLLCTGAMRPFYEQRGFQAVYPWAIVTVQ